MKYKKYLLILLTVLLLGTTKTYALNKNDYRSINNNLVQNVNKIESNIKSPNLINILEVGCNDIFGDKNNPDSLSHLINEILQYPRIIVPIIVIGLGTLDLAKAVIASNEDEMKKAQKTFVKRVIIGVAFFLIPAFVNLIMWLADIVWNGAYPTCGL